MHARVRAVITAVFVLAFFVTAPMVLLLTSGYRYNWKRQRIQKTGLIQVETSPAGARVSLDGVVQKKVTPASFSRLLPEDYAVHLEKSGYLPWEKTLEVRSGETTFVTGVVLYKDALPRLVLDRDVADAAWSPDGRDAAYLTDDGVWTELAALVHGREPTLLARFAHDAYAGVRLTWSPDGQAILFTATAKGGATHVLRFRPDAPTATLALHEGFPKGALTAHWNDDGSRVILVSADGVFSANADTGAVSPVRLDAGIQDAASRGRTTYVLKTANDGAGVTLERLNGDETVPVVELSAGNYRFKEGDDRRLLIADEKRQRMTLVDPSNAAVDSFDATGAAWEAKGRRLLVWNDFEITTINLADGTRTLITRLGTPIAGCAWAPGGDAILFSTASGISLAELDDRDKRNVFDLVRFTGVGPFTIDAATAMLRFVGSVGNQRGIFERDL